MQLNHKYIVRTSKRDKSSQTIHTTNDNINNTDIIDINDPNNSQNSNESNIKQNQNETSDSLNKSKANDHTFEDSLEHLCSLSTLQHLSYFINNLNIEAMVPITDIYVFKDTSMPLWEHPSNITGGQWNMKFPKSISYRVFLNFLIIVTTKKTDLLINKKDSNEKVNDKKKYNELNNYDFFRYIDINGLVLSVRKNFCYMSIWSSTDDREFEKTAKEISHHVKCPFRTKIYFKKSLDSIKDDSGFRYKKKSTNINSSSKCESDSLSYINKNTKSSHFSNSENDRVDDLENTENTEDLEMIDKEIQNLTIQKQ